MSVSLTPNGVESISASMDLGINRKFVDDVFLIVVVVGVDKGPRSWTSVISRISWPSRETSMEDGESIV
jgi:hypothetical protein